MAQTLKIKRSSTTASPSSLAQGELAYSSKSDTQKLFIGEPGTGNILTIGGKVYMDFLDHGILQKGTLTANAAIIVDANSKINQVKTANLVLGANSLTSSTGDIDLVVASGQALDIDAATVTFDTQATEFKIIDNSSTSFVIKEGNTAYIILDTTNSNEKITLNKQVSMSGAYTLPTTDGTNGQALITNGSGAVTFTNIASSLNIAGNSGTGSIAQLTQSLTVSGSGAISTTASNQAITIAVQDATTSAKGVASFDSTDFAVSSGAVTVNAITLGSSSLNPGATTTDIAGLTQLVVDNLTLDGNTVSTTNSNGDLILSPNGTGVVNVPAGYKNRSAFGTNSLATKEYVDAVQQALDIKESVRVATAAALPACTYNNGTNGVGATLTADANGALTVDGISDLSTNQRVLIKNQATVAHNGIYKLTTVGSGSAGFVFTRTDDADTPAKLSGGTYTFAEEGSTLADNGFVFTHNGEPTIGTTDLNVTQFSGAGQVIAGDGLTKSGNTIQAVGTATIAANADSLQIKGITATNVGDLLIGQASDAGYTALAKPSGNATASDYILSMNTSGVASWANVIDGGTFS